MRRWVRRGVVTSHFVEWQGTPVKSVKTGFRHAVKLAGLWGKVTPHTLRHTAAAWLMQRGVPIWQAAGYLGMSAEMIERTYSHHRPDYIRGSADHKNRAEVSDDGDRQAFQSATRRTVIWHATVMVVLTRPMNFGLLFKPGDWEALCMAGFKPCQRPKFTFTWKVALKSTISSGWRAKTASRCRGRVSSCCSLAG
jgi:hypothetical protein